MRTMVFALWTCVLLALGGCGPPSNTSGAGGTVGGGATAGSTTGAGGDGGAPGACVCDPVPSCSPPADLTAWCEAFGPGAHAAINCEGCGAATCSKVAAAKLCFDEDLWCCSVDFNPEPMPKLFACLGDVMCEVSPDVFEVICTYDETVTALTSDAAEAVLLGQCNDAHPDFTCGLWTLTCEAA